MSHRVITALSTNKMVLDCHPIAGNKIVFNFVTPKDWRVGDIVHMSIRIDPHDWDFVNGQLVISIVPEPPNEWKREFYTLYNNRTKDRVTIDFESAEGFEKFEKDHRQKKQ
jgi:hypothetical protein